ncbi:MAG: ABC transporter permease [Deltaproteobacteria bacterium]|nr:ABC transporter permease [Deltaproteobacteria bacterium]
MMDGVRNLLRDVGGVSLLSVQTFRAFWKSPVEIFPVIYQLDHAGIQSWSITALTALFTGMVLALQFATGLEAYGGSMYTGKLVALGIVRELGPTLTALLVGGRVGSGIAAELGSMVVTEQVDAIRALGADPIKKLVAPRVLACTLALPLLTMLADVVGIFGGMLITMREVGVTSKFFFTQVKDTLWVVDLMHGLGKSVFFGYFIGIIGCFVGLQTHGGTEGVGVSTTRAVVVTAITLLISNYILSTIFVAVYG